MAKHSFHIDTKKQSAERTELTDDMKKTLQKRDWTIDEIKSIPKDHVTKQIHSLKTQYVVIKDKADKAYISLANVAKLKQSELSRLNQIVMMQKKYDAVLADQKEANQKELQLEQKINSSTMVHRLSGKLDEWKKQFSENQKYKNSLDNDLKNLTEQARSEFQIDLKSESYNAVWAIQEKNQIDSKYQAIGQERKQEYAKLFSQAKSKRLEVIEKIAFAKDQGKLDEEGHSLREVLLEQGRSSQYADKNADMLKYAHPEDKEKIIERKEERKQYKERDAIGRALQVESSLSRGIQAGLSIGEDNMR